MASIKPGTYTFGEILSLVGFDLNQTTIETDTGSHIDLRRVKVGRLGFDDPEQTFRVPEAADSLDVEFDGEVFASLVVTK